LIVIMKNDFSSVIIMDRIKVTCVKKKKDTMIKIYKLESDNGMVYFGQTTQPLPRRLAVHKSQALTSREINKCKSAALFENNANVTMTLIEEVSKESANEKEEYYIKNNQCVNYQGRIDHESRRTSEAFLEARRKYYRDYVREKGLAKKKFTCVCGREMLKSSKYRHYKICPIYINGRQLENEI